MMKRIAMCMIALAVVVGCAQQKHAEPPAAKRRALPVQPRDMGTEPVALARSTPTPRYLELPRSIGGRYPTAAECAMDTSGPCGELWRNVETSAELFIECMDYQSSEETPRLCRQLFDVDGDALVTLADYRFFDAFRQFKWVQMQGPE